MRKNSRKSEKKINKHQIFKEMYAKCCANQSNDIRWQITHIIFFHISSSSLMRLGSSVIKIKIEETQSNE